MLMCTFYRMFCNINAYMAISNKNIAFSVIYTT